MVCNTALTSTHAASSLSTGAQTWSSAKNHSSCPPLFSVPLVLRRCRTTTTVCSLSDDTRGARIPTSLIGTAAAVLCALAPLNHVVDGQALAASGPGSSGAERTAQKAQDLLKSADKLNVDEAPKRFGPGRLVPGSSATDAGRTAQEYVRNSPFLCFPPPSTRLRILLCNAGGRAVSQMADGVKNTSDEVANNAKKAQGMAEQSVSDITRNVNRSLDENGSQGILGSIKEGFEGLKDTITSKQ